MLSSLVGGEVLSNQGNVFGSDIQQSQKLDIFSDNTQQSQNSDALGEDNKTEGSNIFNMFNAGSGDNASPENSTEITPEEKKKEDEIDIDIPELEEYH